MEVKLFHLLQDVSDNLISPIHHKTYEAIKLRFRQLSSISQSGYKFESISHPEQK